VVGVATATSEAGRWPRAGRAVPRHQGRRSAHKGERKDGNGKEKKGGGDALPRRHYGDNKWATFESSVLAREGKQGGRGSSGTTISGEQGKR
jgi:hypothetical protein